MYIFTEFLKLPNFKYTLLYPLILFYICSNVAVLSNTLNY